MTEEGRVTEVSPLQPSNAWSPTLMTEAGISSEVSLMQSENAYSPIEVTESGIVTEDSLWEALNASLLMRVASAPITIACENLYFAQGNTMPWLLTSAFVG